METLTPAPASPRLPLIDGLRAFAILLMLVYHFAFDLQNFHLIDSVTFDGVAMTAIGRSCIGLFMFCVGYSLALAHANGIHWKKFWHRWLKIAGAAALVSAATVVAFPEYWIFFGILHCIALSSLLLLPVLRRPRLALAIGLGMLLAYALFQVRLPFPGHDRPTLDFIPPYPWSWSAFVGVAAYHARLHERIHPPRFGWVEMASRHSLLIYLLHQPLLYSLAYGLWYLHLHR